VIKMSMTALVVQNTLVAGAIALSWYASRYINLSQGSYEAKTQPVKPEVYGEAEYLANTVRPQMKQFVDKYLEAGSSKGDLDPATVILNQVRVNDGYPPDPNIFEETQEAEKSLEIGILFSNSVALRDFNRGFPLETCVQTLYNSISNHPNVSTWVGAYDKDLWVVKRPDFSYDATARGLLPDHTGSHLKLGSALNFCLDEIGRNTDLSILYVVTNPLRREKDKGEVRQQLSILRNRNIHVAFLYIDPQGNDIIDPLTDNYSVLDHDNLESLPHHLETLNENILEEAV